MASHEPSESFWTLTRPSKNLKKHHDANQRIFNISVVGLSGTEKDKGPIGIGKSCFCNRFIRSAADEFHVDHISVLSQSDFSGRVVNNDHWLYWGSVIKSDEGVDLTFNVIEQTEFVDDSCFQPFKSGKTEPYHKRCANTRLISAEKLMYICKSQLGIEKEYEQRYLHDGKFNVDGFLCLFDVSEVQGRAVERQVEMTTLILMNLMKTKKPVVLVTTKHDEASELMVLEAARLVSKREFRGSIPIVETSALEYVNVNLAFIVCSQLIDRTRGRVKIIPYFEAYRNQKNLLNAASDAYLGLIRSTVIDYRSSWQQVCIKLSHNPEFLQYTYLHGLDKAMSVFRCHTKRLRDEFTNRKVQTFMKVLPEVLNQVIPQISASCKNIMGSIEDIEQSWKTVKEQLRSHPSFERYFVETPINVPWQESDLIHSADNRIAYNWLDSREAKHVYHQILMCLNTKERKIASKEIFSQLLDSLRVSIGQPFFEVKSLIVENENLSLLNDQDLFEIYAEYQRRALDRARGNFQELLSENAEHLHHLTSTNRTITQDDIMTINSMLQHDERYQALERFDQERTLMIIRHLSFIHSPVVDQCPSFPCCVEPMVEKLLLTKVQELVAHNDTKNSHTVQETWSMIIIGPRRPSQQLILALNVLNSRSPKSSQINMNFIVLDNAEEVDSHMYEFKQVDYKPKGCLCIYINKRSLDHVTESLGKLLKNHNCHEINNRPSLGNPPIVMLYAADIGLDERDLNLLEAEGQNHATIFNCPFMNVTALDQYRHHQQNNLLKNEINGFMTNECASLDYGCVDGAFGVLKEAINKRMCLTKLYTNQELIPRQAFNPDIKILMCVFCGEPYSLDDIMDKMFFNYRFCYITSSKSICIKMILNNEERFVELIITSYTHGALNYRDYLLHGFILVCSTKRKASVAIMNAFSFNIPCTPTQIISVKDSSHITKKNESLENDINDNRDNSSANNQDDEMDQTLVNEAQATALRLKGHFMILDLDNTSSNHINYVDQLKPFISIVLDRKPFIEKVFQTDDNDSEDNLDDSNINPQIESELISDHSFVYRKEYQDNRLSSSFRNTGRQSTCVSSEDDLDERRGDRCDRTASDDSEVYSTLSSGQNEHHLVQPSKLKKNSEALADNYRFASSKFSSEDLDDQRSDDQDIRQSNQERPKPGKLDLKQFDNITDAIRKLSVQPTYKATDTSHSSTQQQKLSDSLRYHTDEGDRIEKQTFFKSRVCRAKNVSRRSKELVEKADSDSYSDDQIMNAATATVTHGKPQRSLVIDKVIEPSSSTSSTNKLNHTTCSKPFRASIHNSKNEYSEKRANSSEESSIIRKQDDSKNSNEKIVQRVNIDNDVRDSSESNDMDCLKATPSPSQRQTESSKPNIQSDQSTVTASLTAVHRQHQQQTATLSPANNNASLTPQSIQSQTSSFSGRHQNLLAKRLHHSRQNHGIAVAPPQLPPSSVSDGMNVNQITTTPLSSSRQRYNNSHLVSQDLGSSVDEDILNSEYDQSPIAQRQLKRVIEHKGSRDFVRDQVLPVNSSIDSSELINSREAAIKQLNEILANKVHNKRGFLNEGGRQIERQSSLDVEVPGNDQQARNSNRKDKKKTRDSEKLEKRRLKEEERQRRQEKKLAAKRSKLGTVNGSSLSSDGIPIFVKKCIEFIELEGLDAEGIYRVPGNRAHVDSFVQKFEENPDVSMVELDIPVNAVATALKDFLSKKMSPMIPSPLMTELTELANIQDKDQRLIALHSLISRLPPQNHRLLTYVFSHFVKVAENHRLNSMDSKNLAICWWPTLLPLNFTDMLMFEQMRPHLEATVQTMIDKFFYIFNYSNE